MGFVVLLFQLRFFKPLKTIIRLSVTVLVLGFCVITPANSEKISFSICYEDIENIPYYYGKGGSIPKKNPGLYIEILELVEKKLDLLISFHRAPWARCLRELELNQVDGVLAASYSKSRVEFSNYPHVSGRVDKKRRLMNQSYYLFRRIGSSASWNGKSFKNVNKIGAQIGYSIIDLLKEHRLVVAETSSVQRGLSLLQAGRIDGFATIKEIATSIIARHPDKYDQIELVKPALKTNSYYLVLGNTFYSKYSDLSETIWNEIAEIREKELTGLLIKYSHALDP
ncbi:substrate-binding periplasmic protein [Kiloniella sp.]|uniref:substrate-binding periplasmic protein n=1 Tax=Kiloniella sp. TaxID=1938587 RepID=UPI003B02A28A